MLCALPWTLPLLIIGTVDLQSVNKALHHHILLNTCGLEIFAADRALFVLVSNVLLDALSTECVLAGRQHGRISVNFLAY